MLVSDLVKTILGLVVSLWGIPQVLALLHKLCWLPCLNLLATIWLVSRTVAEK